MFKNLKVELPYDLTIPHLGLYPRGKSRDVNRYLHPCVHSSTVHRGQEVEANLTCPSMDGWMDEQNGIHPRNGILCKHEKEHGYNVDGPWGHRNKDAQRKKVTDRYMLQGSTLRRCLEESESHRQKGDGRAGAGDSGFHGDSVSGWEDEMAPEVMVGVAAQQGNGIKHHCTMPFKMVKMG